MKLNGLVCQFAAWDVTFCKKCISPKLLQLKIKISSKNWSLINERADFENNFQAKTSFFGRTSQTLQNMELGRNYEDIQQWPIGNHASKISWNQIFVPVETFSPFKDVIIIICTKEQTVQFHGWWVSYNQLTAISFWLFCCKISKLTASHDEPKSRPFDANKPRVPVQW